MAGILSESRISKIAVSAGRRAKEEKQSVQCSSSILREQFRFEIKKTFVAGDNASIRFPPKRLTRMVQMLRSPRSQRGRGRRLVRLKERGLSLGLSRGFPLAGSEEEDTQHEERAYRVRRAKAGEKKGLYIERAASRTAG